MDIRPSPSQQMLASTARAFLQDHCPPERVQEWALDARGFDDATVARMAELGWPGLLVAPEHGGSGGSLLDVVLLVEEMGYACLPGPVHRERRRRPPRCWPRPAVRTSRSDCCPRWPPASASPRWR